MASASMVFAPQTFSSAISCMLTDDNFLTWMQLAESTIKGHRLKQHIVGDHVIPSRFLTKEDEATDFVNPAYENSEQQDNLLKSWLLELMDNQFRVSIVGCVWSHEIWAILKTYFSSQTKARIKQLRIQLRNTKKQGSISEYLVQIKQIVETLGAISSPLTDKEHIYAIFYGLPEEYDGLITSCLTRSESFTVPQIEASLMHQEERFEHHKQRDAKLLAPNGSIA